MRIGKNEMKILQILKENPDISFRELKAKVLGEEFGRYNATSFRRFNNEKRSKYFLFIEAINNLVKKGLISRKEYTYTYTYTVTHKKEPRITEKGLEELSKRLG
jgi:hypothetical protein